MAEEHQEGNSVDPATQSMRRKRGRPRKDESHGSEPYRTQRRKVNVETYENDPFVGQVVSGVLDGKFDAGYMLTVRIGERGSVLRGVVFEPGRSVPISPANDIAPNVKMFKRDEISLPSSWQLPYFTPIRSRRDGALRHQQRNESAVSSKEIYTDTVAEDLNADIQKLPENESNHASGNLKQDLQCSVSNHASRDGICNMQSINVGAECSGDIHTPEIGKPSIIASDSMNTVHLQEVVSEDKPITQQSQTVSESKQGAISDGKLGFASDDLTTNLQEVVSDVKLDTQMSQHKCEAKQTVKTFDAGPASINDNKTANLPEVDNDGKPVNEVSQIKTSESKQSAETSNAAPVFMNGTSDDYCKVMSPVTVQISEQITGNVADAKPVMELSQTRTYESEQLAETSHLAPVSKNGASDNYCKTSPPATVQTLGQLTDRIADAELVTEASGTTPSVPKKAVETSEPGPVFKNGASDEYGKVQPPVTIDASEQIIEGVTEFEPVTEVSQTKISESKQPSETSDVGPVFMKAASDDSVKVPPLEHMVDTADNLCDIPRTTGLSVDESAKHSVKLALEGGTVEVADRINSSVGQESRVHLEPLGSESDKPVELSSEQLMDNPLPSEVILEQLQNDQASPCGAPSNEVYSTATSETTTSNFQGTDVNGDC